MKPCKHKNWGKNEHINWTFKDPTNIMFRAKCKKCAMLREVDYRQYCAFFTTEGAKLEYTLRWPL